MKITLDLNQPGRYGTKSALQYRKYGNLSPPSGSNPQPSNFASVPKANLAVHEVLPAQMLHGDQTHSSLSAAMMSSGLFQNRI